MRFLLGEFAALVLLLHANVLDDVVPTLVPDVALHRLARNRSIRVLKIGN
jgi:hypothetical protein